MHKPKTTLIIIAFIALITIIIPQYHYADETLCYTERVTDAASFNIYTGKDDANNPIVWTHNVPVGILDSVVRVGLYIEAWDVDYPPDGDEYDQVFFNGYDLGYLQGSNDSWFTVEKTVPVEAIKEGINNLEVVVDTLGKTWKVTIRASELRFYCSSGSPDFSIGATPNLREINQGESTQYTVNLAGLNSFSSPVTLSVSGLPTGVSGAFAVNPLTPSPTGETTLNIDTTASAATGSHTLTITGTSGEISRSVEVTLKIEESGTIPEADFTIEADPVNQKIIQAETADYTIQLTSIKGFSSQLQLDIDDLPQGVTAHFKNRYLTPTASTTLTLTAADDAVTGTHTLKVSADGGGKNHDTTITLQIEERPPDPDFEVLLNHTSLDASVGQTVNSTITIKPINEFTGTVTLNMDGLPAGTTATFDKNSVSPDGSVQLTIVTTEETPVGDHTLTITGTSEELEHTATLTLNVKCSDYTVQARASETNGAAPLTLEFDALVNRVTGTSRRRVSANTDTEYKYKWKFGDGATSDEQEVEHIYNNPGRYVATVTVTDVCGNSKSASVAVEAEAFEGSLVTSFSPTQAQPGDTVSINIIMSNQTRVDYENVILRNPLSEYLEYVSDTSGVIPVQTGQELTWQFPSLGKNQTVTFTVSAKVSDNAPSGTISNIAYLTHHSLGEGNQIVSNTATLTIEQLQVSLLKQVEETSVEPGGTVKYQLTLKNNSNATLTQLKLSDTLDSQLQYLSQSNSAGLQFTKNGRIMEWRGDLNPQQQAIIILKVIVSDHVLAGTTIANTASVEATKLKEPVQSNTVSVFVQSEPISTGSVRFTKRAEVPQSEVGRIIRFNLTVTNSSNSTLVSPVIEDHLPQGFSYVAGSTLLNNQNYNDPQGSRVLNWQMPNITAGQTYTLRYQIVIGSDVKRGRNENRALLMATDTSGQGINLEDSAFVNVSVTSFTFYSGVEGTVYLDRDHDEFYSMSDTPLEGIEVRLSNGQKAITDRMGQYRFENLYSGEYAIGINTATLPDKYRLSTSYSKVAVLSDGLTDTVDFAIRFQGEDKEKTARLEGRVFYDKNQNLNLDAEDIMAEQFKVYLDETMVTSGSNGKFIFSHLQTGAHKIEIRYGPKTVTQEINLIEGDNIINIPLKFTGIKIIVSGEGK